MKTTTAQELMDEPITEAVLDEAIERGRLRQKNSRQATAVNYRDSCLTISFKDGSSVRLPVKCYSEFDGFGVKDFANLKVGFSGAALCNEQLDLHISIAGMLSLHESKSPNKHPQKSRHHDG